MKEFKILFIFLSLPLLVFAQKPRARGTVQAVEEAIINAMVAAETMEGINGNKAYALPHGLVIDLLKKYNRIK